MHKIYVDKSGDEYSIHCLTESDLELICEAVVILGNSMPVFMKTEDQRAVIRQVITLKNIIEDERNYQRTELQQSKTVIVPALLRRKDRNSLHGLCRSHPWARRRNKALSRLPR